MVMEEAEITSSSCPFFCHPRDDDSGPAVTQSSRLGGAQKGTRVLRRTAARGPGAAVAPAPAAGAQGPGRKAKCCEYVPLN